MSLLSSLRIDPPASAQEGLGVAVEEQLPRHTYIDALRGVAFLGVFLFHSSVLLPKAAPLVTDMFSRGYAGVELFYVLSAYTLSVSLSHRSASCGYLFDYALRRFFRIAPMYWLSIALYCWYFGFDPRWHLGYGVGVSDIVLNALFLHGFDAFALNGVVPGGWSVAVEVQFYLLLPLLLALSSTPRGLALTFVAAIVLSSAGTPLIEASVGGASAGRSELAHEFGYFSLVSQLPVFLCGVGLYRIVSWRRALLFTSCGAVGLTRGQLSTSVVLGVLAVGFPVALSASPWRLLSGFPNYVGYGLLSALLVYALMLQANSLIDNPLTRYLGKISYGCYLMHLLVIQLVTSYFRELDGFTALLLSLALTALLASAAHALVEKPGLTLGRKLLDRRRSA
jgi:peptidoglycan/LPS O-acetylase OafA/YrhL